MSSAASKMCQRGVAGAAAHSGGDTGHRCPPTSTVRAGLSSIQVMSRTYQTTVQLLVCGGFDVADRAQIFPWYSAARFYCSTSERSAKNKEKV